MTSPLEPEAPVHSIGQHAYPSTDELPAAPRKRRTGLLIGLAAAAVLLLAGVGLVAAFGRSGAGPATSPRTFGFNGTFEITDSCFGPGYSDIRDGMQVVVTDEKQTVLAAATLLPDGLCKWTFMFRDVPASAKLYGLTVSHRGTVQYTEAELRAGPHLTL